MGLGEEYAMVFFCIGWNEKPFRSLCPRNKMFDVE